MSLLDVIVVGAGMAGLLCAQRLQQAGYQVRVLEKSRGLGGRMATRRVEGMPIDHGARFLQPQGDLLAILAQHLVKQGVLIDWHPHTLRFDSTGQLVPASLRQPCYVAPAGMSTVGKVLAQGLSIERQQRVVAIDPAANSHWQITAERADNGAIMHHRAKALVLAIPAPQITPLLQPLPSEPRLTAIRQAIATVQYAPCITVMAQYDSPPPHMPTALPCQPTAPWMIDGTEDMPFFWVGLESSKRQTAGLNVVFHSSAAFAQQWIDAPTRQSSGEALLTHAGTFIAPWLTQPRYWQVHRWRYAFVTEPCSQATLAASQPLPLLACGDWCGEHQVDTALASGWAAAADMNSLLRDTPLADSLAKIL
ncbi:MAG: FAD-dependent oxidoreductase [Cyanobacteria bacterium P01_F01_bin.86]